MACRGPAQRDDLLAVDGGRQSESPLSDRSQGPQGIDAEEDRANTLVQGVCRVSAPVHFGHRL